MSNIQCHVTAFIVEQNWATVQQHYADHIWSESIIESKNSDVMSDSRPYKEMLRNVNKKLI